MGCLHLYLKKNGGGGGNAALIAGRLVLNVLDVAVKLGLRAVDISRMV